ncbi:hypothetical protein EJB05_44476, partial [Eragrostis curvula]
MGPIVKGITVLSLVTMVCFQVPGAFACCKKRRPSVPAMYVFGDGVLDVGNNNYLPLGDSNRADHPYYGIDLPGGQPTGRFSNGYNIADFIAMAMGFTMSPPPYLSLTGAIQIDTNFSGINYASADASILNTPVDEVIIPLQKQVEYFEASIGRMETNLSKHELNKLVSKSLFLISFGTIDLQFLYRLSKFKSPLGNKLNVPYLISSYGSAITTLYNKGVRKFMIINVPPFGCVPGARNFRSGGCNEAMNSFASQFNEGLKPLLAGLSSSLQGLRYSIADYYAFSNDTFTNPSALGFEDSHSACCNGPCAPPADEHGYDSPPCGNRTQYWFWDQEFPTERAAKLTAAAFYNDDLKKLIESIIVECDRENFRCYRCCRAANPLRSLDPSLSRNPSRGKID